jgi:hypothetical protein
MKHLTWTLLALTLIGCGSANVREIDPEKEEMKRLNGKQVPIQSTPDRVVVGEKNNITVEVTKWGTVRPEKDVEQQIWDVNVTNEWKSAKCVSIIWRLMDFHFETTEPSIFYIEGKEKKHIGRMVQHVWDIDGVKFVLPPSGQIYGMEVRKPVAKAKRGEECNFFDERKIKEK